MKCASSKDNNNCSKGDTDSKKCTRRNRLYNPSFKLTLIPSGQIRRIQENLVGCDLVRRVPVLPSITKTDHIPLEAGRVLDLVSNIVRLAWFDILTILSPFMLPPPLTGS